MANVLWLIWVGAFFVLEALGLFGAFGMKPLTFWIRSLVEQGWGWAISGALGWFAFHIFVEPFWKRK